MLQNESPTFLLLRLALEALLDDWVFCFVLFGFFAEQHKTKLSAGAGG